jgi:SAM-dependent methyltransferase
MIALLEWLREPEVRDANLDDAERIDRHLAVLARKRMIREVFVECHHAMRSLDLAHLEGTGPSVEIGTGVAPIRDTFPDVWSTDIVPARHLDAVVDAQRLPFRDASLHALYAQNAFHHLPQPGLFFRELERVLSPGGGAILLEPYHGPFASVVYPRLFASEDFDKRSPDWETLQHGPMSGANQALSFVVFVRDRARFERSHPGLVIAAQKPLGNYARYLASGGLNFRQLLPDVTIGALRAAERLAAPLARWLALHHIVVLKRVMR